MINLVLAFLWLCVALTAFLLPHFNPDGPPWTIPGSNISIGWLALAFLIYNLARWWTSRGMRQQDRRLLRPIRRPTAGDEPPDPQVEIRAGPPK
jgi:hypothetical protein